MAFWMWALAIIIIVVIIIASKRKGGESFSGSFTRNIIDCCRKGFK